MQWYLRKIYFGTKSGKLSKLSFVGKIKSVLSLVGEKMFNLSYFGIHFEGFRKMYLATFPLNVIKNIIKLVNDRYGYRQLYRPINRPINRPIPINRLTLPISSPSKHLSPNWYVLVLELVYSSTSTYQFGDKCWLGEVTISKNTDFHQNWTNGSPINSHLAYLLPQV